MYHGRPAESDGQYEWLPATCDDDDDVQTQRGYYYYDS